MNFAFKTIHEFNDYFQDEKTCYAFLEERLWAGVTVCPHCASIKTPYKVKPRGKFQDIPSYRCSEKGCKLPFTVRTGSIFEGSKVELRKWFQAAYEITTSKKGISSVELGTRIGVSQKTAWFINHRLRDMLVVTAPELLTGTVEIDETYIAGKDKNKHKSKRSGQRGMNTKTPMVGLLQRDGKLVLRVIAPGSANGFVLKPIVREHVSTEALIITDGHGGYKGLDKEFAGHEVVAHDRDEYVRGTHHTNTIEGFWGILKRGIYGIYHSVSPQHLHRYCAEFSTRYNSRKVSNCERFLEIVNSSKKERVTYKILTASPKP